MKSIQLKPGTVSDVCMTRSTPREVILNLAGFCIQIKASVAAEKVFLSDRHSGLRTQEPPHFQLRVHYGDRPLFELYDPYCLRMPVPMEMAGQESEVVVMMEDRDQKIFLKGQSLSGTNLWDLIIDPVQKLGVVRHAPSRENLDPVSYPLDHLIIYHLAVRNHAMILHASAVRYKDWGMLFMGCSGSGKSTLARWCNHYGATVIHDDRICLRLGPDGCLAFGVPTYPDQQPTATRVRTIAHIQQGERFTVETTSRSEAYEWLLEHTVQHNFSRSLIRYQQKTFRRVASLDIFSKMKIPDDPAIAGLILKMIDTHIA